MISESFIPIWKQKNENYLSQLIADMHDAMLRVPVSKVPDGVFDPDYQDKLEASPFRNI